MDLNRNQFFFLGLFVLFIGLQLRVVGSYTLSDDATHYLANQSGQQTTAQIASLASSVGAGPRRVVEPPEWLGWCLISVGAVLVLHSLAMPRPS